MNAHKLTQEDRFQKNMDRLPPEIHNMILAHKLKQESDRFQKNMDSLPPELYNMILDLTFCAGPTSQLITNNYKSPNALQVSRATRARFANNHYSLTTFKPANQGLLRRWAKSLTHENLQRIQTIHFDVIDASPTTPKPKTVKPTLPRKKGQPRRDVRSTTIPINKIVKASRLAPKRPPRENNTPDHTMLKRAQARLFFIQSYLGKRNLRLSKSVVYVNVKFDGMREEVWTREPGSDRYHPSHSSFGLKLG